MKTNATFSTEITTPVVNVAAIRDLRERLNKGVVHFTYTKKDGSIREAFGTTKGTLVEKHTTGTGAPRSTYGQVAYFDVEKGAWRSCKEENFIRVID